MTKLKGSLKGIPMPAETFSPVTPSLTLRIRGCSNIVSFKNSKMLTRGRLITNPKKQKAMESYIAALESELLSAYRTSATGIVTGCNLASWIASYMPEDDSWKDIPEASWLAISVPKGEEGADIEIIPLD